MKVLAYVRQWWHCLIHTFGRHRAETWEYGWGKTIGIGCECGRIFWKEGE